MVEICYHLLPMQHPDDEAFAASVEVFRNLIALAFGVPRDFVVGEWPRNAQWVKEIKEILDRYGLSGNPSEAE